MCVCVCVCLVAQLRLTLCDPMDCSPPGSSVRGDSPGKNTGVVTMPSSMGSSQPRDQTWVSNVSHITGIFLTVWAPGKPHYIYRESLSVQSFRLFVTKWIVAHQASLSITNSWSSLKLMSIESVMPSNYLILCHPLFLLPSIFPSIRVFSNESVLHIRWPKYWSFSFSISPSKEYSGLISFRIDSFDLLAVQRTIKSLLQHHSSNASILWHSAFFTVRLSRPYITTGNTIALTRWTFVGKVLSLLFNTLSRLVIAYLPRSKS